MSRGGVNMKGKGLSGRVPLIVMLAVFVISNTFSMYFNLFIDIRGVSVKWEYQASLAEDVVYYNDKASYANEYTEPVLFPKGTEITLEEYITRDSEIVEKDGSYECYFGKAIVHLPNGEVKHADVVSNMGDCTENTNDSFDTPYYSAIHISKLEDYQRVLSDYEEAQEDCLKKEAKERTVFAWIGLISAVAISAVVLIIRRILVQKGRSAGFLFWIFLVVDCVLLLYSVLRILMWISS